MPIWLLSSGKVALYTPLLPGYPCAMYSLAHPVTHTLEIRKSRFLACVEPIADRAAAQARVNELRAQHPGCNHVCWALLAGAELGGELLDVSHGQAVRMQISLPVTAADALQEQLLSITRGELGWEVVVSSGD